MEKRNNKRKAARTKKIIISVAVICVLAAGGGFGIWQLVSANEPESEITTTYYAEAVTYGNVDTTISGSGSLTPVLSSALSCENPATIDTLNVSVGDSVSEGDVIAVVTQTVTETVMDEESMQIVIESSGDGLLVPVDAVHTSGDDNYVYLAPGGAEEGSEYEEAEITLDDLTKVTVETGMSDGSYIMIESEELAEGDLILMSEVSTTATAADSEAQDFEGGMPGGFGGNMDFEGMDFGDMDFGNFDPSNMPSGMPGGGR